MEPSRYIELTPAEEANLLDIARESIERGLSTRNPFEPDSTRITGALTQRLGCFVTLTQQGELRGCVGALESARPLASSVATSAFNTAFRDYRFPPLTESEVAHIRIEISVLSTPLVIDADSNLELLRELCPHEDGLVLEEHTRRSTFLPKVWEKIPEPREFVRQLKAKAGLPMDYWSDSIRFFRYTTTSIAEPCAVPRAARENAHGS